MSEQRLYFFRCIIRLVNPQTSIQLKTGCWFGDRDISLQLPQNWSAKTHSGNPPRALSAQEIKQRLFAPINSKTISEMVSGKTTVAIILDDMVRPTPTAEVLKILVTELIDCGVLLENITLVTAGGSHPQINHTDLVNKIGPELINKIKVLPHDPKSSDLINLGYSSHGVPIFINKTVYEAEVKISISGIYPHPEVGFSGGSKIVAPGVAGYETISKLHATISEADGQGHVDSPFRLESEEIAAKVGLNYSINIVLTSDRKIGGLFAGDFISAHRAAVEFAKNCYRVDLPESADVVISNSYPFDCSYYFYYRGVWPFYTSKPNAANILIVDGSQKYEFIPTPVTTVEHKIQTVKRFANLFKSLLTPKVFALKLKKYLFLRKMNFYIYYTGATTKEALLNQFPNSKPFNNWSELVKEVSKDLNSQKVLVDVYPYASLQLSKIGL